MSMIPATTIHFSCQYLPSNIPGYWWTVITKRAILILKYTDQYVMESESKSVLDDVKSHICVSESTVARSTLRTNLKILWELWLWCVHLHQICGRTLAYVGVRKLQIYVRRHYSVHKDTLFFRLFVDFYMVAQYKWQLHSRWWKTGKNHIIKTPHHHSFHPPCPPISCTWYFSWPPSQPWDSQPWFSCFVRWNGTTIGTNLALFNDLKIFLSTIFLMISCLSASTSKEK